MNILAIESNSKFAKLQKLVQNFFSIRQLVKKIYLKSNQQNNFDEKQSNNLLKQNISQLLYDYCVYETLKKQICKLEANFVKKQIIYQRKIQKQNYEKLISSIIKTGQQILDNQKHVFYHSRKHQVCFIQDVNIVLYYIELHFKNYIEGAAINIQDFIRDIQNTYTISKKIKIRQQKEQKITIQIKYLSQQVNKSERIEKQQWRNSRPQTCKKSQAFTHTTRPSSSSKSTRIIRNYNICSQLALINDSYNVEDKNDVCLFNLKETNNKSKRNKIQRCKTAKVAKKTQQKQPKSNLESKRSNKNFVSMYDELPTVRQRQEKLLLQDSLSFQKNEQNNQILSPMLISKNDQMSKLKKKPRNGFRETGDLNRKIYKYQINHSQIFKNTKTHKGSLNVNLNQNSIIKKRNYQSQQDLKTIKQKKTVKKLINNILVIKRRNKGKNRMKHSNLNIVQMNQKVEQSIINDNIDHKDLILLIKPPQQKLSEHKKRQAFMLLDSLDKDKTKQQISSIKQTKRVLRQKIKQSSVSKSDQQQIDAINYMQNVNFDQRNQIRTEFVKARDKNYNQCCKNQQNSSFFVQQQYLSHRENARFQSYIKRLKQEWGSIQKKEPFNLQNQTIDVKTKRLIQIQRFYTFENQSQWLKQKFHNRNHSNIQQYYELVQKQKQNYQQIVI